MAASALCLVHCLFLPWLIAIAGTYFGSMFESPSFHNIMLVVAVLIGLPVFIFSYLRYKSKLILATGIIGLSLTTFGTVKNDDCCPKVTTEESCEDSVCNDSVCESMVLKDNSCEDEVCKESIEQEPEIKLQGFNTIPLGVTLLILAHFLNFRQRKVCKNECCP